MRPALLIGAGLAALVALATPARAAAPQPCEQAVAPAQAPIAAPAVLPPCEPNPCVQASAVPCQR
jgi:hypothetical protein